MRGMGRSGQWGWPDSPDIEAMRTAWFQSVTADAERDLGRRMQLAASRDLPYMPAGIFFQVTAQWRPLIELPKMFAQFYGLRRAS